MRGNHILFLFFSSLMLSAAIVCLVVPGADAEIISFSGTVTYNGSYAADTLYVAVIDTNSVGDEPTFLATEALAVGAPPYNRFFDVSFDNTLATGSLVVAAALDVDGGGLQAIGAGDVVGWYASTPDPMLISPAASLSGIDFSLPLAELHGTLTFGPDQTNAFLNAVTSANCQGGSFQPQTEVASSGPYAIIGLYPGTYCIHGGGPSASLGWLTICYGDPLCLDPTLVTLTESQVLNGVDLDFSVIAPTEQAAWGTVKSAYR